ncbi:Lrp/AsnC family transcriptional regulator [Rhizobium leguminosarum]|nr:Lrp/AsnC family transcriptional regulator [Rhizobium leguminosarum]
MPQGRRGVFALFVLFVERVLLFCAIWSNRANQGRKVHFSHMLDDRDRRILDMLQKDAGISVTDLAERVALSVSACSRRIQRLEESGHIARRIFVLDREKMGVPTTVFALVKTAHHSDEWTESFRRIISDIPEIVEAHRLTGNHDYILKIVLPRVEHYDVIYKGIVRKLELFDVSASISMEELKHGMAIPVGYAR